MTTFLDFRYSRSLSGALFFAADAEEVEIALESDRDNYLAFDLPPSLDDAALFELADSAGARAQSTSGPSCGKR